MLLEVVANSSATASDHVATSHSPANSSRPCVAGGSSCLRSAACSVSDSRAELLHLRLQLFAEGPAVPWRQQIPLPHGSFSKISLASITAPYSKVSSEIEEISTTCSRRSAMGVSKRRYSSHAMPTAQMAITCNQIAAWCQARCCWHISTRCVSSYCHMAVLQAELVPRLSNRASSMLPPRHTSD